MKAAATVIILLLLSILAVLVFPYIKNQRLEERWKQAQQLVWKASDWTSKLSYKAEGGKCIPADAPIYRIAMEARADAFGLLYEMAEDSSVDQVRLRPLIRKFKASTDQMVDAKEKCESSIRRSPR